MMLWGLVWLEQEEAQTQCGADLKGSFHPAPPGMPLSWVPGMAGPFFSWTPGSLSGSQSRLARRLLRRLCWPAECRSVWSSHHGSRTAEGYYPQCCCHL